MRFVLDTNAVIGLLKQQSPGLFEKITSCAPGEIGIPSVVAYELYFGAFKSQKIAFNLETLRLFMRDFEVLDFNQNDAREAGEIRSALEALGQPIGPYDVLIAGQTKARELTLVTNNIREFGRVPGLKFEDWLSA